MNNQKPLSEKIKKLKEHTRDDPSNCGCYMCHHQEEFRQLYEEVNQDVKKAVEDLKKVNCINYIGVAHKGRWTKKQVAQLICDMQIDFKQEINKIFGEFSGDNAITHQKGDNNGNR